MQICVLILLICLTLGHAQQNNVHVDDTVVLEQPNENIKSTPIGEELQPNPPKLVKEDPAIPKLISWATRQGANVSGVEIVDTLLHGRGIVALEDLPINHTIISLPFEMLVTSEWITKESPIAHLLRPNIHSTDAFAIYLAANRADNHSIHREFIDSLPEFVPLPLFYSQHLLDAVKNTTLETIANTRRRVAYSSYARLDDTIKQHVSKADWMWALSIVWSRSFGAAKRHSLTQQWKSVAALVPLIDFLNTGQEHEINVKCRTAQQGRTFACTTMKEVKKGDELLVSYGQRSNSQLLHDYGFALFTPANDVALFKLPSAKLHRSKGDDSIVLHRKGDLQDALDRAGKVDKSFVFTLKAPAVLNVSSFDPNQTLSVVIPDETFGWARLCVVDVDDTEVLEGHEMLERIESGERFNANNELRAIKLINQSITEALSHFPQTIEEDLEQLNGGELVQNNGALFWITLMRFYEKSILVDVSALIDEKIAELKLESVKETAARQIAEARRKKEQEEKTAKELAKKAEKERLRRQLERGEDGDDDSELDDEDEDEDPIKVKSHLQNSAAAWQHRDL